MNRAQKRQILVDHYFDFYHLAFTLLKDEQDAQDAVQDAIVKTLVRHGVQDVKAYCSRCVRNGAISLLRRRLRHQSLEGIDLPDSTDTDDRLLRVAQLRDGLPEQLRDLIVLHDQQGYTYHQLASLTGLSHSTIRRRIKEAHNLLKTQLETNK